MDTSIVGVGVGITDRFRTVVEEKSARIENIAPRAEKLDVKVTHRAYHNGRMEDSTVELTLTGKGLPVVRAEAVDGDKFTSLDLAVDKLCEQIRRAKEKRVDARNHPRKAHFAKGTGELAGIDVQPASVDTLEAVATGAVPVIADDEEAEYTPVVIRTKSFEAEWMSVEDAVDRMELVGHDFFLFIDARTDHPSVVYRRKGWDYGVIALATLAQPAAALVS
ncbi:MAG: ribosome-associated translation inhibitor RaiA [Microbacterium sp.]|uniref:ribosome hibernation-promoting factor, HPF/YfiA family n=1 Tax=Microbacterium sp. TaxID=51671 RepID=UPI0039E2B19E